MKHILARIIDTLTHLGHTQGLTFRTQLDDGVGMLIVPNPRLTHSNLNTRPARPVGAARISSAHYSRIETRGFWKAKAYTLRDKLEGVL